MIDELYQFLVCDYYATGEGRTVMLLITRAYPRAEDRDENYELKVGYTSKVIAAREFADQFGKWYLQSAENLPREEFVKKHGHHLPEYVHKILNAEGNERPGNFSFKLSIHFNYA